MIVFVERVAAGFALLTGQPTKEFVARQLAARRAERSSARQSLNVTFLKYCRTVLFVGALTCAPLLLRAGDLDEWRSKLLPIAPNRYLCRHAENPILVDGKLNEPGWATAAWTWSA